VKFRALTNDLSNDYLTGVMNDIQKTRKELARELDEMRRSLENLEVCRRELDGMRERYEKLLNAAPDAMIFVNRDQEIVLVNAQAEALFGYSQGDLTGRRLETLIPHRFRERHRRFVGEYFASPKLRYMGTDLKIFGLKTDGTEFRADISLSPLRLDGEMLATAAVRDITERVSAQELIERNYHIQRVINAILKNSMEPLSLHEQLDRALNLILSVPHLSLQSRGSIYLVEGERKELVLKAECGMTESQRAACERVPFGKCLCGRTASTCGVEFADCVDEGHEMRFEDMFPHGHYCVPIVSGGKPLGMINMYVQEGHRRDPAEEAFLSAVADTIAGIIERNAAEREKQRLQEQLVQSEKLAALGRITANVAHEIRNPITSVGGFAKRLQKKVGEGTIEREYAGIIVSEVAVLENLLRDVLSFSRNSVPLREEHSIREVVDSVLTVHEQLFREHAISVERSYAEVPEILMDKEQVKEVIVNLLMNAIDAMPGGGKLSITTAREVVRDMSYVTVKIKDTGIGLAEDMADKIFEPFFTTKTAKRGVGLGLPISKKIMEDHGGFISVESKAGEGVALTLHFPLRQKES
jgi:PAS domain S-box-containing protein